ncbi:MAG: hypothetical protein NTX08_00960 [Sphingobacteriales bacterium]|nr:hypothetical protein [Sphingobacteriales bacterium]
MQFKEVIGQQHCKTQLVQLVQQNRLGHALLFLGKEGSGALSMAMAFSQYLVCEKLNGKNSGKAAIADPGPSLFGEPEPPAPPIEEATIFQTDSCGVCPACIKANQLIHPDIHFSYPVISGKPYDKPISTNYIKEWRSFFSDTPYGNVYDWLQYIEAENKQGNITAQECNDIIRKLNLKSFESEYKILIMWMPQFLGKEGNKLLKLFEEPPPNTLFILVAENDDQILPTILSRTQLIKIPALSNLDVEAALELQDGVSMVKAQQIAALSEGNYHEALQLIQIAEDDWQGILRDWLNAILKTGPVAQIKWIDEAAKLGREKQKQFLKYFIHLLEQSIKLRVMESNTPLQANNPETDFALRLNKLCSLSQMEAIINELDKSSYYIERNANAKMLFHALSIRIYHIISNNSLILVN